MGRGQRGRAKGLGQWGGVAGEPWAGFRLAARLASTGIADGRALGALATGGALRTTGAPRAAPMGIAGGARPRSARKVSLRCSSAACVATRSISRVTTCSPSGGESISSASGACSV